MSFECRRIRRSDDDFPEEVSAFPERQRLLVSLRLVGKRVGRLDVYLVKPRVDYKVDLELLPRRLAAILDVDFD